jgi:hypothetical protein
MVNNSSNLYKTNNHLSPKESLNSDGQQFQQSLQNKQSPLTSKSLCFLFLGHVMLVIDIVL